MARYNLRSKVESGEQDSDGDSQRKRLKLSERKPKAKDIKLGKSNMEEVIHIDSDLEIENSCDVEEEKNVITPDTWMESPNNAHIKTDFCDFEKKRSFSQFLEGQIWAIYDDYGMPRRYVQIDQISLSTNSIYVTFLKHASLAQEKAEEQNNKETISWFQPVCGSFTPYSKGLNLRIYSFSHIVSRQSQRIMGRGAHNIYPKKGEVWALYKDGNRISSPRMQTYQLVEILTDFSRNGLRAVYLVKFGGRNHSLYKRHVKDGVEVFLQIGRNELERFSHQVPSFRILNNVENILLNGCLELDPASLPFYIDNFTDGMEPQINNKFLCLKVLDYKSLMMKEKLKENNVWAMYDDRNGLPRTYAVIENNSGREVITWLEPCPISEDEKKWYKAGLPIACGNFKSKKTSLTCDYSMFSHPIQCDWDSFNQQYNIHPRKGEVWGIYKDWEIGWSSDPKRSEDESNFEYEFVEILTDFRKNEGVNVVSLTIVGGFSCLFRRQTNDTGVEIPFLIDVNELYRFSHQIQNCKIHESSKIGNGCLVLDPIVVFLTAKESFTLLQETKEMDVEADKKDCSKFVPGQIWALYEDPDCMPHSYAIVCNTYPDELKVEVKMLKPHPVCEQEMEWADKNLPISCGVFRVDEVTTVREISEFSHQVTLCDDGRIQSSFYRIIPQIGEVWAVYQNREEPQRHQMVEIISCFDEETGLTVAPLFGVGGSRGVFQRHFVNGFELIKTFSRKEMLQFSHRVPGSKILGNGDETLKGHWKLDSAAVPIELSPS